jgi:predicted TPR repeat methyltransferase
LESVLQHARSGRLTDAESGCIHLLSSDPDNVPVLRLAAELALRRRKPDLALPRIERAVQLAPYDPRARCMLGEVYEALNRAADAITQFLASWRLAPHQSVALDRLIVACMHSGRIEDGVGYFKSALAMDPPLSAAHAHLLPALASLERSEEVIVSADGILAMDPLIVVACSAFGNAMNRLRNLPSTSRACRNGKLLDPTCASVYLDLCYALYSHGRMDKALACMRALATLEPENPTAAHLIAALSGVPLERASAEYCSRLFDACASQFDNRLVEGLRYDVPRQLSELLRGLEAAPATGWDTLDLGCGTGLVGPAFRQVVRRLVGIDVSAAMLEYAKRRLVYDQLEQIDIVEYVRAQVGDRYDLVVAADVFIYLGQLDSIFAEIQRLLRARGRLLFSIESLGTATTVPAVTHRDYALTVSGRFAHTSQYIRGLALRLGFVVEAEMEVALRIEHGGPCLGWLYALRRT